MLRVESKDICSECRGACCENMPGATFPEDFGIYNDTPSQRVEEILTHKLKSGRWQLDIYDLDEKEHQMIGIQEDKTLLFVRPAPKLLMGMGRITYQCPPFSGCTFHTKDGCELPLSARPLGCSSVIPSESESGECKHPFLQHPHFEAGKKWLFYIEELLTAKNNALAYINNSLMTGDYQ